jgi:hypothetical protein
MKIKESSPFFQEPIHVIWFSILPLLIMMASNISEINIASTLRVGLTSLGIGVFLFGVLNFWKRNKVFFAIILTFSLLTFFTYGHFYDFLRNAFPGIAVLVRHRYLLFLTLGWFCICVVLIGTKIPRPVLIQVQSALNWIGLILVSYNLATIFIYQIQESGIKSPIRAQLLTHNATSQFRPDVYFIILDSYTREDVMKSFFEYDNSNFLGQLKDMGFFIPPCSQSNYSYTIASVSTTLNMDYLDHFNMETPANTSSFLPYQKHFQNSLVKKRFQEAGYKIVTSDSEYPWLVWKDADVIFKLPSQNGVSEKLQPFELMYLKSTVLRYIFDQNPSAKLVSYKVTKYQLASYQISRLKTLAVDVSSPKFLFINLEVTHPPFVFNPDGSINTETGFSENLKYTDYPQFKADYVKAVQFVNTQVLEIIHNILANSQTAPIIVIQGDHGFRDKDYTNMNFEAFLIPGAESYYYPKISPVNTFRIIENVLFGEQLALLPDLHYHRVGKGYYEFEQVLETMPGCRQ